MQVETFQALEKWFLTPQGEAISAAFTSHLHQLDDTVFHPQGKRLIQLGHAGKQPWLDAMPFTEKWILSPHITSNPSLKTAQICAFPKQLPLNKNTVDALVLPMTLETYDWQHHPIHEIDRVLKPMGHIIILGINAMSLWGLALRLGLLPAMDKVRLHPHSLLKLKKAWAHYGYSLLHLEPFYYIPPVKSRRLIKQLEIFNELGKMISPCPAGFYCMILQKYTAQPAMPALGQKAWTRAIEV